MFIKQLLTYYTCLKYIGCMPGDESIGIFSFNKYAEKRFKCFFLLALMILIHGVLLNYLTI